MHPHPPMPHSPFPPYQRWYTDVEPAYERPAECECHFPPMPSPCVCVTEEDAANWNGAYSAMSAVSAGLDLQVIASAGQLLTSADYWNQTHDVVSANSATWQTLPQVSSTLAEWAQSAIWMIETLSSSGVKHDATLTGDGFVQPLGIEYADRYEQLIEYLESLTANQSDLQSLYDAMQNCKDELVTQIAELSGGHIQNFELILQILGKVPNSGNVPMIWKQENLTPNNAGNFSTQNWMYYSTYKED